VRVTNFVGTFHWIAAEDNGPSVPFSRPRMSAFAYVEPHWDVEGAVIIEDLPSEDVDAPVTVRWLPGYPMPVTRPGDTVTVTAAQRPIATITVTAANDQETRRA
jgi:hypothetical protein